MSLFLVLLSLFLCASLAFTALWILAGLCGVFRDPPNISEDD